VRVKIAINKKVVVAVSLAAAIIACAAGIKAPALSNEYKNLQVLPKNISTRDLQKIMVDEFQDGLGVTCSYCHAQEKDGSLHLDYASDEKPEKQIARKMMVMSIEINKNYFDVDHPALGSGVLSVTCITCHQGAARPPQ
jgi:flagellar motor component MotA